MYVEVLIDINQFVPITEDFNVKFQKTFPLISNCEYIYL